MLGSSSKRQARTRPWTWLLVWGLLWGAVSLSACSEEDAATESGAITDEPDAKNPEPDAEDERSGEETPDLPDPEPDMAEDEPDMAEEEPDMAEEEPDVPEEEPDMSEEEPDMVEEGPYEMECMTAEDCTEENYSCIFGICTLNPAGDVFIENNYVIEEPSALTTVIGVIKAFFRDVGFFMTHFTEASGGEMIVTYGGGDRIVNNRDAPDVWAWQLPFEQLPSFRIHRLEDPENPLQGTTWQSDPFDYQLFALFGERGGPRNRLGLEAKQVVATMTFSEDLNQIVEGRLEGYITREETELRMLGIENNCFLQRGLCPTYDCENDEPFVVFADVLDCNNVALDSDIDETIPGNDAYRAEIFFVSDRVELLEEE